jgi:hypothetical protein
MHREKQARLGSYQVHENRVSTTKKAPWKGEKGNIK